MCVLMHDLNYNKHVAYASFTGNFKVKTVIIIVIDYFDW